MLPELAAGSTVTLRAVEVPLTEAAICTVALALTAKARALNAARLDPAPIVTAAGTVRALLLLDKATVVAVSASLFSSTVQITWFGPMTDPGVQFNCDMARGVPLGSGA